MLTIGQAQATPERPIIAVPVTGTDTSAVLTEINQINDSNADVIEWRVDYLTDLTALNLATMQTILFNADRPIIFTWRTTEEGGRKKFDHSQYQALYQLAILTGVAAVDIEFHMLPELLDLVAFAQDHKVIVIGSSHDFAQTPATISDDIAALIQFPVDAVKVATMAQSRHDSERLLAATATNRGQKPLITMAMGELGRDTRIRGIQFGSELTFASLIKASAPGQLALHELPF